MNPFNLPDKLLRYSPNTACINTAAGCFQTAEAGLVKTPVCDRFLYQTKILGQTPSMMQMFSKLIKRFAKNTGPTRLPPEAEIKCRLLAVVF